MKKLVLILLISNLSLAQDPAVEIRLVNDQIGQPAFNYSSYNPVESDDAGLNAILQAHNVFSYIHKGGHLYPSFVNQFTEVWCGDCNLGQLASDLSAYSSVVARARVTHHESPFDDNLYVQLQTQSTGIPIGETNGIVVTNDAGLNQIFQDFNVYYYVQSFPYLSNESLLRFYSLVCNCNNTILKTALENYSTVVNHTEYPSVIYLLSATDFEKTKATIFPNPFSSSFHIESENPITQYTLIDITGKTLLVTVATTELDMQASRLSAGLYVLNLQFENGHSANYKLVKK